MKNLPFSRYPTQEELYALELEARRLRSVETARLLRAAANAVQGMFKFKMKELGHA